MNYVLTRDLQYFTSTLIREEVFIQRFQNMAEHGPLRLGLKASIVLFCLGIQLNAASALRFEVRQARSGQAVVYGHVAVVLRQILLRVEVADHLPITFTFKRFILAY